MSRQTLLGNQVGTLSVPLYGYPAPTIKWSSDPPLAPDSSAANYYLVEDYSGVAQLTYQRVSDSMSGNYVMTATNLVHDVSYSISFSLSVDVFYPPAISLEPTWEILEMATAKIPCLVTSRPAASHVTWSVNGSDVTELNKPSKLAVEEMEVDARERFPWLSGNWCWKRRDWATAGSTRAKQLYLLQTACITRLRVSMSVSVS